MHFEYLPWLFPVTINYDYRLWLCCDYEQTAAATKFGDYKRRETYLQLHIHKIS